MICNIRVISVKVQVSDSNFIPLAKITVNGANVRVKDYLCQVYGKSCLEGIAREQIHSYESRGIPLGSILDP